MDATAILKGLTREVSKRMNATLEHASRAGGWFGIGRARSPFSILHVEAYGTKVPLNQVLACRFQSWRAGSSRSRSIRRCSAPSNVRFCVPDRSQPGQRRQSRIPSAPRDRRARASCRARAKIAGRRRRIRSAPRCERSSEEVPEGPRHLGRRREGSRRGAEVDRQHHRRVDEMQKKKDHELLGH